MKKPWLLYLFLGYCLPLASANSSDATKATVKYLRDLQSVGGGFLPNQPSLSAHQNILPSLRATSAALRGMKYLGGDLANRQACIQFLKSCHDPASGGFADHPGGKPDVISTANGIMALKDLNLPLDDYQTSAVKYLEQNAHSFEEIRMAVAGLESAGLQTDKAKGWRKQILQMKNPDGTYGKGDGIPRDTAGVVVTLLRLGETVEQAEQVREILRKGQRNDGGYGKEGSASSDLESSYRVVRALVLLKEKPAHPESLLNFVARCRNSDAGFGAIPGQPSNAFSVYFGASIRHWLSEE